MIEITTVTRAEALTALCKLRPDMQFAAAATLVDVACGFVLDETRDGFDGAVSMLTVSVGEINARQLVYLLIGSIAAGEFPFVDVGASSYEVER